MFVHHVSSNVSTHWEGLSHSAQHKMGTQPVRPQDMGQKKQAWVGRPAPGPGRGRLGAGHFTYSSAGPDPPPTVRALPAGPTKPGEPP